MKSQDSKSLWTTQPEKPAHYSYLKEFRVEQCPLFLQHKCTQHRPYTCFHWHFLNQRRRRPIRKRDGSFNYSPDNYCTKFDENTGVCPDGDDCPFLHRTAGDTERRYHLRYYKTGMCVHDTDVRGFCVKNGAHCAFAHGVEDVRPPVYDLRELHQSIDGGIGLSAEGMQQLLQDNAGTMNGTGNISMVQGPNGAVVPNSLDKERNMINDDPRWQDTAFVLANYKTEPCKRPPRLCRQGYACPQYHNSRDRRRPPKKYKYRSTACPNVKHSDEWGEPSNCESGDSCQYCHTRTEQQFHPEIYKSSKCNDIQQTGYCPRGVFCAFAHVDQEMTAVRESAASDSCTGTSLADILNSALPPDATLPHPPPQPASVQHQLPQQPTALENAKNSASMAVSLSGGDSSRALTNGFISPPNSNGTKVGGGSNVGGHHHQQPPIGSKSRQFSGNNHLPSKDNSQSSHHHQKHNSIFGSVMGPAGVSIPPPNPLQHPPPQANYLKAPGSERETETNLKKQQQQQMAAAAAAARESNDRSLEALDNINRKSSNGGGVNSLFIGGGNQSSLGLNNGVLSSASFVSQSTAGVLSSIVSTVSPLAQPFYPTSNTVESVVGNALDELNLSDITAAIDPDFNSISSSLNSGLASSGLISSSAPVTIPGSVDGSSSFHHDRSTAALLSSLQQHSSSPSNAFTAAQHFLANNSIEQSNLAAAFLRATNGISNPLNTSTQPSSSHLFDASNSSIINTCSNPGSATTNSLFNNFPQSHSLLSSNISSSNVIGGSNKNNSSIVSNAFASLGGNALGSVVGNVASGVIGNSASGSAVGSNINSSNMSPHQRGLSSQSPLLFHSNVAGTNNTTEIWRLKEELINNRAKLASWEEGIAQARTACDAWKREVDDAHRKIKNAEQTREELLGKLSAVQGELDACRAGKQLAPYVQVLHTHADLEALPRHVLQQLAVKLRQDTDAVDKALGNTCTLPSEWSNVPSW